MKHFEAKTFDIPELIGISKTNIEEHLKLYAGYVKFTNQVADTISELKVDAEKNVYLIGELKRRFSFEYNGMKNHEYYFASLSGGHKEVSTESNFCKKVLENWNSFEDFITEIKMTALTRGIGWVMVSYDKDSMQLVINWVDEQHLGQLNSNMSILCLDMWEHSYVADYQPSGKKTYIEDFFKNINWSMIEQNYERAQK
jgi:Fe-Mn family superoxide dismutase